MAKSTVLGRTRAKSAAKLKSAPLSKGDRVWLKKVATRLRKEDAAIRKECKGKFMHDVPHTFDFQGLRRAGQIIVWCERCGRRFTFNITKTEAAK